MSVLWTPAEITTALWLDADDSGTITLSGSDVTQWDDKSGNDRHATPDGNGTITTGSDANGAFIDVDDDAFDLPALGISGADERSLFVVVEMPTAQDNTAFLGFNSGTFHTNGTRWSFGTTNSGDTSLRFEIQGTGYSSSLDGGGLSVYACLFDGTDFDGHTIYKDGVSDAVTGTATINTTDEENSLGQRSNDSVYITADYREVVLLPTNADTETRQKLEGYLAHKWGLEDNLDSDHPYKSEAPTIPTVENLQATSLGSDSIQVTWDQFENDESPPVAADGYEIEIDSGTPIDVGDVQTYTDEGLDPSTQYSYRVRAYYSGSPTEYTEWSGVVQATTDAEELTTIPRSFVITADIKLRDEAPEVTEPPSAVEGAIAANLLEHWDYEEGSGSTITGNKNNTVMTAVAPADFEFSENSKLGSFCGLQESGHRLGTDDNDFADFTSQSFSCAVWLNALSSAGSPRYILARYRGDDGTGDQYRLAQLTSDNIEWRVLVTSPAFEAMICEIPGAQWDTGEWNLVQCSWDAVNGIAALYLNGALVDQDQSENSGPFVLSDHAENSLFLWGSLFSSSNTFLGRMDDTLIYTKAATLKEHQFLWNGGAGRPYSEIA